MKFDIIYIDPPWCYSSRNGKDQSMSACIHYKQLTFDDIKALDIKSISSDNSVLFLWITSPWIMVAEQLLNAWGFKFKTIAFTWVKYNPDTKKLNVNPGYWTLSSCEHVIVGSRGKLRASNRKIRQLVMANREKHSKKPDVIRDNIVSMIGDKPRIEIFARNTYPGWTCIGNEIDGKDIRVAIENIKNVNA